MAIEGGARHDEARLLQQGPLPGPLRRGGNRGQSDDASGAAKYGRWLADVDRIGEARPPRSRANGKTKTRGNIAGQTKHLAICAKAFVPDAASRSDRTGPLVASGDAGDRLAIYFNRGTLMSRWSEGYFMTTSRLRRNAADGKPCSTFLELPLAGHPSLRFWPLLLNKAIVFMIRRGCSQARDEIAPPCRNPGRHLWHRTAPMAKEDIRPPPATTSSFDVNSSDRDYARYDMFARAIVGRLASQV